MLYLNSEGRGIPEIHLLCAKLFTCKVPFHFLQNLHQQHENWMLYKEAFFSP